MSDTAGDKWWLRPEYWEQLKRSIFNDTKPRRIKYGAAGGRWQSSRRCPACLGSVEETTLGCLGRNRNSARCLDCGWEGGGGDVDG